MPIISKLSSSSSSEDFQDCLSSLDITSKEVHSESDIKTATTIETESLSEKNNSIVDEIRHCASKEYQKQHCSEGNLSQFKESREKMADDEKMDRIDKEDNSKKEDVSSRIPEDDEIKGIQMSYTEMDDEFDDETMRLNEESLSPEELEANKDKALAMKEEANKLFRAEQTEEAIKMYTSALNISPLKYTKERAILFGNRAAAKIKYGAKKSALDDCTKALELWPQYVRVILRYYSYYDLYKFY